MNDKDVAPNIHGHLTLSRCCPIITTNPIFYFYIKFFVFEFNFHNYLYVYVYFYSIFFLKFDTLVLIFI